MQMVDVDTMVGAIVDAVVEDPCPVREKRLGKNRAAF